MGSIDGRDREHGGDDDLDDPLLRALGRAPAVAPRAEFAGTERFEIVRKLGEGASGAVYEARDLRDSSAVALKVLRATDPDAIYRFKREFRLLSGILHPNLARLDELVAAGDRFFIVMELVRGVPFDEYVAGSLERLRAALPELARGLFRIHSAGKVHRDVKPSNVLVERGGRVVLLDFGLLIEESRDVDTAVAGTPRYMAPERFGAGGLRESSDWYSVGVMLYEALTGSPPKGSSGTPRPSAVKAGVPPDLDALCMELLDPDPDQRPKGPDILERLAAGREAWEAPPADGFVGRRRELDRIGSALESVFGGRPSVLVLHGAPGVGKTALLGRARELLSARHPGLVWLEGKCREGESVPYKALDGAIDALVGFLLSLPVEARRAMLPRDGAELVRQFPVCAKLFGAGPEARGDRRAALSALRELVGRVADVHPVVIALDDLQWGDADSATVLDEMLRAPKAPLVLYLGACREGERGARDLLSALGEGSSHREWAFDAVRVDALDGEDAVALAREVAGTSEVDVARAVRESGGNPLFLRELVLLGRDRPGGAAPTLSRTILERVDRLGEEARRFLTAAAVADAPESPATLCRAAGTRGESRALVAMLRAAQLVRAREHDGETTVECYHDRIREVLAAVLTDDERQKLHRDLARALSELPGGPAERIARHYAAAGDHDAATEYAVTAGRRAAASFAFDHAIELFRLAIDFSEARGGARWEVRRDLGDVLATSGRGNDAADAYLASARHAPADEALDLRRRAATTLLATGYVERGLDVFRSVMKELGLPFPKNTASAVASLVALRARIRIRGLDYTERSEDEVPRDLLVKCDALRSAALALQVTYPVLSVELAARCLLLSLESGVVDRILPALYLEAAYSALTGGRRGKGRTRDLLALVRRLAEELDEPGAMVWSLIAHGMTALLEGRFGKAHRLLDELLDLVASSPSAEKRWPDLIQDSARLLRMNAIWQRGLVGYLRDLERRGNRLGVMWMSLYQGYLLTVHGRAADGRALIDAAMEKWSMRASDMQDWWKTFANVFLDLYERRGDDAWTRMQAAWPKLERDLILSDQLHRIEARTMLARAALALARTDAVKRKGLLAAAEKQCKNLEHEDAPWATAFAKTLRASVASFRGDPATAELYLSDAIPMLEAQGIDGVAASARRALGLVIGGKEGQALLLQSNAWMEFQDLADPAAFAAMYVPGPWE
jgi:hypothetical protein